MVTNYLDGMFWTLRYYLTFCPSREDVAQVDDPELGVDVADDGGALPLPEELRRPPDGGRQPDLRQGERRHRASHVALKMRENSKKLVTL